MNAYKSTEAESRIKKIVAETYKACPVKTETLIVDTESFGESHVLCAGNKSGPALILFHGASGNSASWFGMMEELCLSFKVFLADIPGQPGLSDAARPGLKNGETGRWAEELISKLCSGPAFVGGMSLGACIALDYGLRNPQKTKGIALISPSGLRPPRADFFFKVLPLAFMGRFGQKRIMKMIYGDLPVHKEVLDFAMITAKGFNPMTETPRLFTDEEIEGLDLPLMFLGGREDPMLHMPGSAERLGRLLPGSRIILREGFAHVLADEGETLSDFFLSIA